MPTVYSATPVRLRDRFPRIRKQMIGVLCKGYYSQDIQINFITSTSRNNVLSALQMQSKHHENVEKRTKKSTLSRLFRFISMMILVLSFCMALVLIVPSVYYHFNPPEIVKVTSTEEGTPLGGSFEEGSRKEVVEEKQPYVPPVDGTLPEGEWLIIPRIGVRTELIQTENHTQALDKGVWWVPDFGRPGDQGKPMILVAHRYGYKWWWQDDYWKYHSFYLLPELEPGDLVEVIVGQRKWIYEIYAGEEGTEISDYQADLILYTCKYLNSPIRHFRYARVIDPTANSQLSWND